MTDLRELEKEAENLIRQHVECENQVDGSHINMMHLDNDEDAEELEEYESELEEYESDLSALEEEMFELAERIKEIDPENSALAELQEYV